MNHFIFDYFLIDQDDGKEDGKKLLSLLEIVNLEFETTYEDMPELKYLESKLINQVKQVLNLLISLFTYYSLVLSVIE